MPMASILTLGAVGGERAVRSLFRDAGDVRRDLSFRSTPEEERRAIESMSDIWKRVG